MSKIKLYQVDAFTSTLFSGNPAAVCVLDSWLDDKLMQSIGSENNLAETAFLVPRGKDYEIRWFTPSIEVDLCGHATLASAFVLFDVLGYSGSAIKFYSLKSGLLTVTKKDDLLMMDFPTDDLELLSEEQNGKIGTCIGLKPIETYKGKTDFITVIEKESDLKNLQPDLHEVSKLKGRGLVVTAKGDDVDFVSRFFAPQTGIPEDPVTGSSHTSLLPLWSKKLGKASLVARQLSKRGGQLFCEFKGDRCLIGGNAKLYLTGEIYL
ncbi:PhzF family phenazine biosynthesis protein [Prevotella sp.]|uniref:PhzF family phenazine biosynthesis protein n=1 Tax=Prevotella sp. TaxID=59823 RepID=UPI002649A241|nr:PhzF family phenazine biosynthesis protein [Prevotella sp.]MDN5553541.1 PhzF family phenazine biosynthesis protein [Prevotella sp.]